MASLSTHIYIYIYSSLRQHWIHIEAAALGQHSGSQATTLARFVWNELLNRCGKLQSRPDQASKLAFNLCTARLSWNLLTIPKLHTLLTPRCSVFMTRQAHRKSTKEDSTCMKRKLNRAEPTTVIKVRSSCPLKELPVATEDVATSAAVTGGRWRDWCICCKCEEHAKVIEGAWELRQSRGRPATWAAVQRLSFQAQVPGVVSRVLLQPLPSAPTSGHSFGIHTASAP